MIIRLRSCERPFLSEPRRVQNVFRLIANTWYFLLTGFDSKHCPYTDKMIKNTPNKRKSLATAATTPNKIQKTGTPLSQKKNKSPNKNPNFQQKKQLNGKQTTPKEKKLPVKEESEDDEVVSDEFVEQEVELNGDSDESGDEVEQGSGDEDEEESGGDDDNEETGTKNTENKLKPTINPAHSVHVGGVNFKTTTFTLRKHFDDGTNNVLSVFICKNPINGLAAGRAFVNFKTEAAAQKALEKNGTTVDGRTIKVEISRGKPTVNSLERKQQLLEKLKRKVAFLENQINSENKVQKPGQGKNKFSPKKPFNNKFAGKKLKQKA